MRTPRILVACPAACAVAMLGIGAPALAAQQPPPPAVVASAWSAAGAIARVTCPAGTQLVGGGLDSRLVTNLMNQVIDGAELNAPDPGTPNTWQAQVHRGLARAFAMCSPDAPTPTVVVSAWTRPGWIATATCPAGTQLVGGGQDARLVYNYANQVIDGVELNAPDRWNPNTWQVQLHNGQARAFAMCTAEAPTPTVVSSDWSEPGWLAKATCPTGTQLIGGGVDSRLVTDLADNVVDDVEANTPDPDQANTWKTQAHRGQSRAFVMCTSEAPTPIVVASDWSQPGAVARATCPTGTQIAGGGQDARLVTNFVNQVVDAVELNAPDPGTPNTWQVQLHSGQARAFAMCTP